MIDLDCEISSFRSMKSTDDAILVSVAEALNEIKLGTYKTTVEEFREKKEDFIKRECLPAVAFHGKFNGGRNRKNFHSATGIIIVDIDDVSGDLEQVKKQIMDEFASCLACMISPSGTGLKCLYLVDADTVDADTYRKIGREISKKFDKFGKTDNLSVTDCLIMTSDENIAINEDAIIDYYVSVEKESKKTYQLGRIDPTRELFDDPEEFFETVLFEAIAEMSDNNFHFIQMSVFDLAKYGFTDEKDDLNFVISYSESVHKVSKSNSSRFAECVEKAKDIEQSAYPYRFGGAMSGIGSEKYDEHGSYDKYENDEDGGDDDFDDIDVNNYGLIDYSTIKEEFWAISEEGDRTGYEISLKNFADIFRFKTGVTTVTGIPGQGKTEFVDQCVLDLARLYGSKTAVAGFEQREGEHISKYVRKLLGFDYRKDGADLSRVEEAFDLIVKYIKHVDVNKTGGDIQKIIRVFESAIKFEGIGNFVVDPFNLLSIKSKSSGHEKVSEILQHLVIFSKRHNVNVVLVAHPKKMIKDEKTGKYVVPDFYDVKGSSAFFEMSYHGLVVYRDDDNIAAPVLVEVLKVKQNNLGERGARAYFRYKRDSGRYIPVTSDGDELDSDCHDKDWIDKFKK